MTFKNLEILTNQIIESEIAELESFSKQGESYTDDSGRYGWRNPIREDTGNLLRTFVIATAPKRILEIGTAHGLSALYLVSGLADFTNAVLDTIELDPSVAAGAQERMNRCKVPVNVHNGDAFQVIEKLKGHYDLVFFDAQKSHYHKQLTMLIDKKLIGLGTVLIADNVIDRQTECQSFLDWFAHEQINHYILPTECGLLIAKL